jgi:phage gpG-like protein
MALDNQHIHGADALLAKLKAAMQYIQNDVPKVIGIEAVKHFKENFVNEGFDGNKWQNRKAKQQLQRTILTGQGSGDHLADSIDYRIEGSTIVIYTDKPYGQIHNEGGTITQQVTPKQRAFFWAKHKEAKEGGDTETAGQYKAMALCKQLTITVPKREFMGNSPQLNNKITNKITRDLTRLLT